MPVIRQRVVFFADLRGSTALYESSGNAQASAIVGKTINRLAAVVAPCGGQVVKTLGDGLMAVFERPADAVDAAQRMQQELFSAPLPPTVSAGRSPGMDTAAVAPAVGSTHPVLPNCSPMALQMSISSGEVVEVGDDCLGDAVNIAARLLHHAGDNECLLTQEVYRELAPQWAQRCRRLPNVQLRGRAEAVAVYALALVESDATVTLLGDAGIAADLQVLALQWGEHSATFSATDCPVAIGRGDQADVRLDDVRVSRSHARIDAMGGTFVLSDLSINGTYVLFSGDEETLSLRRGACTLHGSGLVGLGCPLGEADAPTLSFQLQAAPP